MILKKVSICIPAYEQPDNLDKCLASILEQTFTDYEVIITDDSKTDSLRPVVAKYINKIDIKYSKNNKSKGSPENWNESLMRAKGKYIKILHHDDNFRRNTSLEEFVNLIENDKNAKVVFCSSSHIDNNGKYLSNHILNEKAMTKIKKDTNMLLFGNMIGAPSIMMYESSIDLKFDKRMKWLVDIDFYIRLLKDNKFVFTQEELININIGEEERVTASCIDDRVINIYETMIMFEKFNLKKITFSYKLFFLKLFLKFNIRSCYDIEVCGYKARVDTQVSKLFSYVKLFLPIYKLLRKIKRIFK